MKRLSVIIPLYNGSKYIEDSIETIERENADIQDELELVVVDDGSKDDGPSVVQMLQNRYSNIVLLHKENGGIASAREFGLQCCHGDYLTFCDQDDSVVEGYASYIDMISSSEADILMCDNYLRTSESGLTKKDYVRENRIYGEEDCKDMSRMLFCPEVYTPADAEERHLIDVQGTVWNCIFRTSFIKDNNVHFQMNVNYEDDWIFIGTALGCCKRLLLSPRAYYCWTINPKSRSHTTFFIDDFFAKRQHHKELLLSTVALSGGVKVA